MQSLLILQQMMCVCVYICIYLSLGFKWLILVLPLGTRVAQSTWSLISGPDNPDDRNRDLHPHRGHNSPLQCIDWYGGLPIILFGVCKEAPCLG